MDSVLYKTSKFFLYLTPLCLVIVTHSTFFPFVVGKYVWFRVCVDLALISFSLAYLFSPDKELEAKKVWDFIKSPLSVAVGLFVFIFLLAGFFGVNPQLSFWSNFERGEGGLQILHLYLFFVLAGALFKNKNDWKRMMGCFLAGGVGAILFGLVSAGGWQEFRNALIDSNLRLSGSIGNPDYSAVCLLFMLFYSLYLFFSDFRGRLKSTGGISLIFLSAVFFLFFILAETRGAFAGLIAALVFFLGYMAFKDKKWRRGVLAFFISAFFAAVLVFYLGNPTDSLSNNRLLKFSLTDRNFTDRVLVWEVAWNGFLARPVLGWGPENFRSVFGMYFHPSFFSPGGNLGVWFDRAHNIYFDYLAETGAFGFLSFLVIFFVFFRQFFKSSKTDSGTGLSVELLLAKALLLSVPVAYLVQGLALFDTLPVYLNLFFFLSFSSGYLSKKKI